MAESYYEITYYIAHNRKMLADRNVGRMRLAIRCGVIGMVFDQIFSYATIPKYSMFWPIVILGPFFLVSWLLWLGLNRKKEFPLNLLRFSLLFFYLCFFAALILVELFVHPDLPVRIFPFAIVAFSSFYMDDFVVFLAADFLLYGEYALLTLLFQKWPYFWSGLFLAFCAVIFSAACFWINLENLAEGSDKERELAEKSSTDLLTGLLNKLSFEEETKAAIGERKGGDLSALLILDFDDFKKVNDGYGHQTGDDVLKSFARILYRNFRNEDLIGRVGGDEFMVFMPRIEEQNKEEAFRICDEILHELYILKVGEAKSFSCSIGIATDQIGYSFSDLYRLADEAMYESKERGKACYSYRSTMKLMQRLDG